MIMSKVVKVSLEKLNALSVQAKTKQRLQESFFQVYDKNVFWLLQKFSE